MAIVISSFGLKKENVLAHVHSLPGEKPKLNQGVKQMLLQGSLKRRCVPYLTDRNRQAVPGFRCLVVGLSLATGSGEGEVFHLLIFRNLKTVHDETLLLVALLFLLG